MVLRKAKGRSRSQETYSYVQIYNVFLLQILRKNTKKQDLDACRDIHKGEKGREGNELVDWRKKRRDR